MDIELIIKMYTKDGMTLREIGKKLNTYHRKIGDILRANGVTITRRNGLRKFSEDHRRKLSEAMKGRKCWASGRKMTEDHCRKNMASKLNRPLVTKEKLSRYEDFERLKFLNKVISRHRREFVDDNKYIEYLDRFYFCSQFNRVYDKWIESGRNKWFMPSIDHINPVSNGGRCDLDNIQFITWFENRAKAEMTMQEWNIFKLSTNTKSDLFS